jgi:homoserine O-acetyltransferase
MPTSRCFSTASPNAEFRPIRSIWGHAAGVGWNPPDTAFLEDNLRELLAS